MSIQELLNKILAVKQGKDDFSTILQQVSVNNNNIVELDAVKRTRRLNYILSNGVNECLSK